MYIYVYYVVIPNGNIITTSVTVLQSIRLYTVLHGDNILMDLKEHNIPFHVLR